jgi:hypothetical protein
VPGGRRPGGTGTASRRLSPAAAVKVAVGLLFVSHAAIAMAGSQKEHNLSLAISARDVIGQAKGILMERHKVTGDQAFRLLAQVSQRSNSRLAEVARHLVETGELTATRADGPTISPTRYGSVSMMLKWSSTPVSSRTR